MTATKTTTLQCDGTLPAAVSTSGDRCPATHTVAGSATVARLGAFHEGWEYVDGEDLCAFHAPTPDPGF